MLFFGASKRLPPRASLISSHTKCSPAMRCFILYADLSVSAGSPISGARTPRESAARKEENVSVPIPSLGPHVIVGQSSGNQLWNEESCSNVTELVIDHSRPFLMRESRCVSPCSSYSSSLFHYAGHVSAIRRLVTDLFSLVNRRDCW